MTSYSSGTYFYQCKKEITIIIIIIINNYYERIKAIIHDVLSVTILKIFRSVCHLKKQLLGSDDVPTHAKIFGAV